MGMDENLKRATVDMVILSLLLEQDMYGYQLSQEISCRTDQDYEIQEGSMYPVLYRLTEKGLLTTKSVQVGARRKRIYYHISETGIAYLNDRKTEYFHILDCINQILKPQS